ncbi:MAG TPA: NAD(P)/FAD-dependent oxidoreductase [Candidatus Glassbacteria bacterium]|nr:NAD(P)/FAD-dependent oxidoreductase [Candidatus Glassbacteria bacterium]
MSQTGWERAGGPVRVAVVGGGPAGTFFVWCLMKKATSRNLPVDVTIFEPKTFEQRGAYHCNYCQGVISAGLLRQMERIGLAIPPQVIQARIKSYSLVTLGGELNLPAPPNQEIYTVFRGHGPVPEKEGAISFDQFLLDRAIAAGARKVGVLVRKVSIEPGAASPVSLVDHLGKTWQADVLIGAFGVNSKLGEQFRLLGFGYRHPATSSALQAEYRILDGNLQNHSADEIKIFALGLYPIRFGVITPKRSHLTVSMIGEFLRYEHLERFMQHRLVRKHLPAGIDLASSRCSCAPQIPVSDGGELAGPHCLIVGDAAVSRYYKNGIESALLSAELAAEVLLEHGCGSKEILREHYTRKVKKIFKLDNQMGRLLYDLHDRIYRLPSLAYTLLAIAQGEFGLTGSSRRKLRWILWNMFTGDSSYRRIFFKCLDPLLLFRVLTLTLSTFAGRLLGRKFGNDDGR